VALTAGAFQDQQAETPAIEMNGFVTKPFDVDNLIATVLWLTQWDPAAIPPIKRDATMLSIDMKRGLCNWGDRATYHRYLDHFVAIHGQDCQEITRLLTQGRRNDAAALVHKLKGAAGSMALMTVWRHASSLEQTLNQGKDADTQIQNLLAAMVAAESEIATLTHKDDAAPVAAVLDAASASSLPAELLRVLDRDSLDEAEAVLAQLSGTLPADQFAALRQRLDSFDLRGAEAIVRTLAAGPVTVEDTKTSIEAVSQ
jgi:HPt (histidine-containing phosphotransfer) domain-containing protein